MSRDLKISIAAALAIHLLLLWGFQATLSHPPKLLSDSAVDVSLVAAPPAPPVPQPPPPEPEPEPPKPQPVVKPPTPLPLEPDPQPVIPAPQPEPAAPPPPAPAPAGDNTSPQPGADQTTVLAQSGDRSLVKYRSNPKPVYPPLARRRHEEGVVLLAVQVDAKGRVTDVTVKRSSGFSLLDESALKAVRGWEFEPARVGSIVIESEIEIPIRFQLK